MEQILIDLIGAAAKAREQPVADLAQIMVPSSREGWLVLRFLPEDSMLS